MFFSRIAKEFVSVVVSNTIIKNVEPILPDRHFVKFHKDGVILSVTSKI